MTDTNANKGVDAGLIDSIKALIAIPDESASHRVPGAAKQLLSSAAAALESAAVREARSADRHKAQINAVTYQQRRAEARAADLRKALEEARGFHQVTHIHVAIDAALAATQQQDAGKQP